MKYILSFFFVFGMTRSLCALDSADKDAIQEIIAQFTDGWNHSSGQELANHYSEDADFVNIFGMLFTGKQEIEARHAKILDTFMKGSTFEVTDLRFREVHPGLVIAQVWWKVTDVPSSDGLLTSTMNGIFSHVFVRDSEGWKITFTQNTPITFFTH